MVMTMAPAVDTIVGGMERHSLSGVVCSGTTTSHYQVGAQIEANGGARATRDRGCRAPERAETSKVATSPDVVG